MVSIGFEGSCHSDRNDEIRIWVSRVNLGAILVFN
jgi:hypothetical protein